MDSLNYLMVFFALTPFSYGINVNLQGSLSLGKDVIESLTHYMLANNLPSRRLMSGDIPKGNILNSVNVLNARVNSTVFCRVDSFCEGKLELFLKEYLTTLVKSLKAVLLPPTSQGTPPNSELGTKDLLIFEEELDNILKGLKQIIRTTNVIMTEKTEVYHWIDIIKKVAALFQESFLSFAGNQEAAIRDPVVSKFLRQKVIIAIVKTEVEYESKLCSIHDICTKSYECTKALCTFLGAFPTLSNDKVQIFMRQVYAAIQESEFYSHLSETTANEFQIVLNDMAFSDTMPTKEVLQTIKKIVDGRLNTIKIGSYIEGNKEVDLVRVILSNLDHFYAKEKTDQFHVFLKNFFEWTRGRDKLKNSIHDLIFDLRINFAEVAEELQIKMINEVKVFLEITVDPES